MTAVVFKRDTTAPVTLAKGEISLADTGSNTAAMYVGNNTNVPIRVIGAPAQLQVSSVGAQSIPTTFPATKTFAFSAQPNLQLSIGTRVRASNDATHYMEGTISSYTSTSLVVAVDRAVGTGTLSGWSIGLVGDVGATGATGATGPTGPTGATGAGIPAGGAEGQLIVKSAGTGAEWQGSKLSVCTVAVPLKNGLAVETTHPMVLTADNTLGATVNGSGYWVCPATGVYDIYVEGRPVLDNVSGGIYGFGQYTLTTSADVFVAQGESSFPVNGRIGIWVKLIAFGVALSSGIILKFKCNHFSGNSVGALEAHTATVKFCLRR